MTIYVPARGRITPRHTQFGRHFPAFIELQRAVFGRKNLECLVI